MRIIQTIIILIAVLVVSLLSRPSSIDEKKKPAESSQQLKEAAKLPAFKMTDANGNIIELSSFKGKKVFVNLWATWCPPCKAEIPSIEGLASKADKEQAVFILLSLDENFEVAKKFAKS